MKITIKYFSLISFILFAHNVSGQDLVELSNKYNTYRNRLLNEWIVVSPDVEQFGVNIPAVDRRVDSSGVPTWVSWSDGNSNFNHWLGILATEYKLLKNNNQNYNETLSMLVYAMIALERLDLYSEYNLRKHHNTMSFDKTEAELVHYPDDINGFLLRDDVSLGFWRQYHDHFRAKYGWHLKTKDGTNTYLSVFRRGAIPKEGMSQDNIIYLLQSLALVKELVATESIRDVNLVFINDYIPRYLDDKKIFENDSVYFDRWVIDLTDRLIRQMQHAYPEQKIVMKPHKGKAEPSITNIGGIMSSAWYIMNPITNDLVAEGNGEDMGVWMNSYGVAEAGNYICSTNKYHVDGSDIGVSAYLFKSLLYKNMKFLKFGGFPVPDNIDDYMFRTLASIADINWDEDSYDLLYLLGDKRDAWTYEQNALILVLLHSEKYKHVYSANSAFYKDDFEYYTDILNQAPIDGPSTDFTREDYSPIWSTSSRFNWPNNNGNRNAKNVWEYAGMDYLFLYNLYRLVFAPEGYEISNAQIIYTKEKLTNKYPIPNMHGIDAEFYYLPPKK